MKKNAIVMVLVFLFLSGTTVYAQNSQTGVKKEIINHSEQTDNLQRKKIQESTLSVNHFEKLDTTIAVKAKPLNKKTTHKKKKKQ